MVAGSSVVDMWAGRVAQRRQPGDAAPSLLTLRCLACCVTLQAGLPPIAILSSARSRTDKILHVSETRYRPFLMSSRKTHNAFLWHPRSQSLKFRGCPLMHQHKTPANTLFLRFLFIYLTQRERESTRAGGAAEAEGEAASPLGREPDAGLDPRTLRS